MNSRGLTEIWYNNQAASKVSLLSFYSFYIERETFEFHQQGNCNSEVKHGNSAIQRDIPLHSPSVMDVRSFVEFLYSSEMKMALKYQERGGTFSSQKFRYDIHQGKKKYFYESFSTILH